MGKKLSEDEIKYILSVESSKAQQEIYKFTKETKELNKTNKERRSLMRELESLGKKESDEYKRLDNEVKKNNETIQKNNKLIKELEKKLDLTGLTMVQLRKKAKDLRAQLDQTVKSTHPEEYAELESELAKVTNRMEELRNTGKYAKQQLSSYDKAMVAAKKATKAFIAVEFVRYLKDIGMKAYETRKEYARFEATLRNATGSSKEAATAMKMLQQLAKETPASVAEWNEAYIKLINRGIKPTSEELIAMGDIAMSQGKDIDQFIEALLDAMTGENERLKEFGITASKNGKTTAYTFKGVTTEVDNTDTAIKNYILSLGKLQGVQGSMATQMKELAGLESNLGDQIDSIYNKIGKKLEPGIKSFMGTLGRFMGKISESLESSGEKFDTQLNKVVSLQTGLVPLLNRYDELKNKTSLSAQEQNELNLLITQIAQIIPGAVSGFDNYGRALSISTDYAREWIKTEKARLAYINKSQIEERKSEKKDIEERIKSLKLQESIGKRLYGVDKEGNVKHVATSSGRMGYGPNAEQMKYRKMTVDEQNQFKEEMKSLYEALSGIDAELSRLQGTTLDDMIRAQTEMTENRKKFNEMNKESLSAWIADEKNATNEYLSLAKEIYKNRFPDIPVDPKEIEKAARKVKQAAEKEKKAILDTEKDVFESMRSMREEELIAQDKWYNEQKFALNISLQEKNISQEQYSIMMLALDKANSTARLNIEKAYYEDSQSLLVTNIKLKEDFIRESNKRIVEAEKKNNEDLINEQQKINDIVKEFKQDFNLITPKDAYQMEIDALNASYNARKDLLISNGKDLLELEESFEKAKLEMAVNYEKARQQALDKYGLVSLKEKYKLELNEFAIAITEWELSTEEIIAGFLKIKTDYVNKLVNTWTDIFSNAFQSLQDAEINNIESKYNKEIEAAKGNADEVERLEQEKEQKKLDIQKKYADVNFAIKVSQIIADTAVSVMKAYADLGPIAGAIAAAVVSATGAIQIAAANAERQKVKSMTASGSSNNSASGNYTRVPGKQSGGYIDVTRSQDGKEFQAVYDPKRRGYIDHPTVIVGEGPAGMSREWVASNEAVKNPTVAPILSILDQAQQAGTIRTLDLNRYLQSKAIGRQDGGSVVSHPAKISPVPVPDAGLSQVVGKLNDTLIELKREGLPAYTLLDDFDRARKLQERSRKIGSKS
jgi:hypothetical protein